MNKYTLAISGLLLMPWIQPPCFSQEPPIWSASLGVETNYTHTTGDTWYSTWADDGNLYVTADDTYGVDSKCKTDGTRHGGNYVFVAINRLSGNDPSQFHLETVNCMASYDVPPDPTRNPPDGVGASNWKTTGITSIEGVLYLVLVQDTYKDASNSGRETSENATIIKSLDHGLTWSGSEEESAEHPMFPGRSFGGPSFIQYGQDGRGGADGADRYVYAISNNGSWDNGDALFLGRVLRGNLPRLRGSDWEFYADGRWVMNSQEAKPILKDSNHLGQSSIVYNPGLHRYLLATWSYPKCTGYDAPGCDVHRSRWVWYQAPAPWGPWSSFQSFEWFSNGYYNPAFVNKFFSSDGARGWVLYAGYFWDPEWYLLTAAPFTLDLNPTHIINDSDMHAIKYIGHWNSAHGMFGEFANDLHSTADPHAEAVVHFHGCGIRVLGDFATNQGSMDLELDDRVRTTVSTHFALYGGKQLSQRSLWEKQGLTQGDHTLRITKKDGSYLVVDAFVVSECGQSKAKNAKVRSPF